MKTHRTLHKKNRQSGVALLIAIFTLLLIAAIACALIVSAGTETSLAANYRATTSGYYAAVAGIEEARGRLLPTNPNSILASLPVSGVPAYLPTNKVVYLLNPGIGETAANVMTTYPDNQFASEFPSVTPTNTFINSVWVASGNNGPLYKWVRINAATKASLNVNVDNTGLADTNATVPLYYDASLVPAALVVPPVIGSNPNPTSSQQQAFEITALAVNPNGSQKILQYVVAAANFNMNFQAALTLSGTVGNFSGANSNPYHINGNDGSGSAPAISGCTANQAARPGIGVSAGLSGGNVTQTNQQYVINNLPRPDHYLGAGAVPPSPSVSTVTSTDALQSTASLDQLVQNIQQNADAVIPNPPNAPGYNNSGTTYNFGQTGWPTDMSATNPKVVYVDGSFDLGPNTGYGILVVTGNFHYHGNSGWNGIILVVGDGTTTFDGQGGGSGQFDGAIFVATTRDANGNQLANYGTTNFDISGGGGNGIYYNSCWISKVQQPPSYQVLSFREINQ
jgi:Tfp pilus assembly protein PilX